MKFRAFLGDFTGVLQWIYRGFQSFFGGSSVVLRFSSGVLLLSCVFFRRFTLVLRMFYVCFLFSSVVFGGLSIVSIPKNNSALNRYFYFLYTVQLVFSSNNFFIRL